MKKILLVIIAMVAMSCSQTKIAYIDIEEVMNEYEAMIALEKEMMAKQEEMAKELQTMQAPFQVKVQEYYQNAPKMSATKRASAEQELQQQQQMLQSRQQQMTQLLQQENQLKTEALINKIDSVVTEYSKSKSLGMVLGTQGNGTVMYGDDKLNVTSDVVALLNSEIETAEEETTTEEEVKTEVEEGK